MFFTMFKAFVLFLFGIGLLSGGLLVFAVPGLARESFRRTRQLWPHARLIWAVYLVAFESFSIGLGVVALSGFIGALHSHNGVPVVYPVLAWQSLPFWAGLGLICLGVITYFVWSHTLYRPARRRYGAVRLPML